MRLVRFAIARCPGRSVVPGRLLRCPCRRGRCGLDGAGCLFGRAGCGGPATVPGWGLRSTLSVWNMPSRPRQVRQCSVPPAMRERSRRAMPSPSVSIRATRRRKVISSFAPSAGWIECPAVGFDVEDLDAVGEEGAYEAATARAGGFAGWQVCPNGIVSCPMGFPERCACPGLGVAEVCEKGAVKGEELDVQEVSVAVVHGVAIAMPTAARSGASGVRKMAMPTLSRMVGPSARCCLLCTADWISMRCGSLVKAMARSSTLGFMGA